MAKRVFELEKISFVEYAPSFRSIQMEFSGKVKPHYLPFPYVRFAYKYGPVCLEAQQTLHHQLFVNIGNSPLKSLKEPMWALPITHTSAHLGGYVCMGHMFNPKNIEEAVGLFWNSTFYSFYTLGTSVPRPYLEKWKLQSLETVFDWMPKYPIENFVKKYSFGYNSR